MISDILLATDAAREAYRNDPWYRRTVDAVLVAEEGGHDSLVVLRDAHLAATAQIQRLVDHEVDREMRTLRPLVILREPEVPVQRDERAEKLGERLDAMVAECNANHRIISRLEERVRELDAAWLRHTWPCGHISEGTGDEPDQCRICVAEARARNAEALAANLRRVENERAIELMRVKRAFTSAAVRDAVERLVKAVDVYTDYSSNRWSVGMTKLLDALNDPALAAWRRK